MARYGCPLHGGPEDGHVNTTVHVFRDGYAENHGAKFDEQNCISRAAGTWRYCGSSINHPVTYIYRPTGK